MLKKLGRNLPYNPAIWLLGIYPEKIIIEKDTCMPMFSAALFTITSTWKQPRCPSTNKWIKKMWYVYTMECYSSIKRNEFESVLVRWINLESVIQSEVSQKKKNKCCVLMHIYGILKNGTDGPIFRARIEIQTYRKDAWTQKGQEREGWIERAALKYARYHMRNRSLMGSRCVTQGAQSVLCDHLEGWDGGRGGREVQERGDSCWCMAETNTIL